MSRFDTTYDPAYRSSPRPSSAVWPSAILLIFLAALLGGLVYWFWPLHHTAGTAEPRPIAPAGSLSEAENATIKLFEQTAPSVVHVTNVQRTRTRFSLNVQEVERGLGSGFVWDKDGHIVTNYHVVEGANVARVVFQDGKSFETTKIWTYPDRDIAVLELDGAQDELKPILVGTSHDLKVGQATFAIGNPYGLDNTLTTGIVSALGREITSPSKKTIRGVIQTSAAINPGNSGGPLLDSFGRLIGMNTAILSESGTFGGIGFAIPVDEINRDVPQLINNKKVVRPQLGVQVAEDQVLHQLAQQLGVNEGALVVRVVPNSPAAAAGLRGFEQDENGRLIPGDVIVSIDGQPIKSGSDLFKELDRHKAGDTVKIDYVRNKKKHETQATLQVTA